MWGVKGCYIIVIECLFVLVFWILLNYLCRLKGKGDNVGYNWIMINLFIIIYYFVFLII